MRSLRIQLVRLTSDAYNVPEGTLGYVTGSPGPLTVVWCDDPGPGGASVSVLPQDLEPVCKLSVTVPQTLIDEPLWSTVRDGEV